MNWLYALLFFLFLFIAKERSSIWGEGITRIKFWIGRIIPNLPIISQLKSKLFFVRILSTTWDAQFQFSYSALSSTSRDFFQISYSSTSRPHSFFIFSFSIFFILSSFIFSLPSCCFSFRPRQSEGAPSSRWGGRGVPFVIFVLETFIKMKKKKH